MIIERVDQQVGQQDVFRDYRLDGKVLTIGGIAVDLEAEQGDQQIIITFACCGGTIHRGMMSCGKYAAEVLIPPRRYETVEVVEEVSEAEQRTHIESVPVPLDIDCVTLKLWPWTAI